MKILIIGGGNMGLTYAQSFLEAHVSNPDDLMILEKSNSRGKELDRLDIGTIYYDAAECIPKADLIILAVKPQDIDKLFDYIKPFVDPQQLFLSIMAGVKMSRIAAGLSIKKIIRAMPNLPAQIGMGMTAFTSSHEVTRIELVTVQNLLNTTGKAIYLENEDMIDSATAISGSGPAYVFYFMNAMMEGAKSLGFTESQAELLVGQTFMGSVHLVNRNKLSCAELIDKVASRGGTTEAALNKFSSEDLHEGIKKGAQAAMDRAIELGK